MQASCGRPEDEGLATESLTNGVETRNRVERCKILTKQIADTRKDANAKTKASDANVTLEPLKEADREQLILDNQEAFKYWGSGATRAGNRTAYASLTIPGRYDR